MKVDERGAHREVVDATNSPIACGIMFRKDFLYEVGLYDEQFRAREEEDLRKRWLEKFNIYNMIIPLYRYRIHETNLTKDEEAMQEGARQMEDKHRTS